MRPAKGLPSLAANEILSAVGEERQGKPRVGGGQATWGGRFKEGPDDLMVRFGESVSFDHRLAPFDIRGSQAHAAMLCHVGLLSSEERDAIVEGLDGLRKEIELGRFQWDMAYEDVHMNIEQELTRRVPCASKLHAGRSRNDQVATDMRLFLKSAGGQINRCLHELLTTLVEKADAHQAVLMPGYTHLQRAQPVSLAHHLLAYVEMFHRDCERFQTVVAHANVCPLGSGAIAGTSLPIDREFVARELGFVDCEGHPLLTQNSMDAVADRDVHIEFAGACALCASHGSRIAEDLIIWHTAEFDFVALPDAFTTGSSLMPHKKNPDSLELLRGKAARLQGNLQTLYSLLKGLPLTYNRDLQEDKPPIFDSFDQLSMALPVLNGTISGLKVNESACAAAVSDPVLLATDLCEHLVMKGVAFRDAHHIVGRLVALAEDLGLPLNALTTDQVTSVDDRFGVDWREVMSPEASLLRREKVGMPGPNEVKRQIDRWQGILAAPSFGG